MSAGGKMEERYVWQTIYGPCDCCYRQARRVQFDGEAFVCVDWNDCKNAQHQAEAEQREAGA